MEYNHDILKDLIAEEGIARDRIEIESVWEWDVGERLGHYIMVETVSDGITNPFSHSILRERYENRVKERRDNKLKQLGI